MAKSPFPFFAIGGPPRDRGMQYGAQCKATIRKTIEFYRWIFEYESNINWDHCLLKAAEFRTYILDYDIEILEEMEVINCKNVVPGWSVHDARWEKQK